MNSTHCTNKLSRLLYNLMICDEEGSWVPGAQMLTGREDSDIVAADLRQVSPFFSTVLLLTTYLIYRSRPGTINDGTFVTCSQTTSPIRNVLLDGHFTASSPVSKRCHTFSAKSALIAPFGKPSLMRPIGVVKSTSSLLFTIRLQRPDVKKHPGGHWILFLTGRGHTSRRNGGRHGRTGPATFALTQPCC